MGVLGNPLAESDGQIEGVKTNGNNCQQKPQKDATPKLEAVAIKYKSVTVNKSVSLLPLQKSASAERSSDAKSDNTQKCEQKNSANVTPKTTCESRSHNKISYLKMLVFFTLSRNFILPYLGVFVNRQLAYFFNFFPKKPSLLQSSVMCFILRLYFLLRWVLRCSLLLQKEPPLRA